MKIKYCMECGHWQYNGHTERKYGEGTGYCSIAGHATGCNRAACLAAVSKEEVRTITKLNVTSVSMLSNGEFGIAGTMEVD